MMLTQKDEEFLEKLKTLKESKDLWVELKPNQPSYMVLKGTYGEKIHKTFRMTRQGVRWWFYRLFNQVYVEAFETILMIEKIFGTQLRGYAIRISNEKYAYRREVIKADFVSAGVATHQKSQESKLWMNHGYTFELQFWELCLRVFNSFHCVLS
jgi:hypothetical protein